MASQASIAQSHRNNSAAKANVGNWVRHRPCAAPERNGDPGPFSTARSSGRLPALADGGTKGPADPKGETIGFAAVGTGGACVEVESVIDLFAYDAGNEVTKFFHDACVGDEDGKCPWLRWIWLL